MGMHRHLKVAAKPAVRHNEEAPPAWAPPEVVQAWRDAERTAAEHRGRRAARRAPYVVAGGATAEPNSGTAEGLDPLRERRLRLGHDIDALPALLRRLVTEPKMAVVWRRIREAGTYRGTPLPFSLAFLNEVIRLWRGPIGEETWGDAHRAKWCTEVAELACALAVKLRGTLADEFPARSYYASAPALLSDSGWHPGAFSDLLLSLANFARPADDELARRKVLLRPRRLSRPPAAKLVLRQFFFEEMQAWLERELGEPHTRTAWRVTCAALETSFDPRAAARLLQKRRARDGGDR